MLIPQPVTSRIVSDLSPPENLPIPSPLAEQHAQLGARMAEFGGWSMPLSYAGVVEEHLATRSAVGVFDVSHLGKAIVRGEGPAGERGTGFVNRCFTNDLDRIGDGQAQYTLCCDEETGGVVDDLIVYRGKHDVLLVPNAANAPAVLGLLESGRAGRHRGAGPASGDRDHRRTGPEVGGGPRRGRTAERHGLHGVRAGPLARPAGDRVPHRLHRRARLRADAAG